MPSTLLLLSILLVISLFFSCYLLFRLYRCRKYRSDLQDRILLAMREKKESARRLHGNTGPLLSVVRQHLQLMKTVAEQEKERTSELLADSLHSLRHEMALLYPPSLDNYGLQAAFQHLADLISANKRMHVSLISTGESKSQLLPIEELELYYLVAGTIHLLDSTATGSNVVIHLMISDNQINIKVIDDRAAPAKEQLGQYLSAPELSARLRFLRISPKLECSQENGTFIHFNCPQHD